MSILNLAAFTVTRNVFVVMAISRGVQYAQVSNMSIFIFLNAIIGFVKSDIVFDISMLTYMFSGILNSMSSLNLYGLTNGTLYFQMDPILLK